MIEGCHMYNKMKTREKGIFSFLEKIIIGRGRPSMYCSVQSGNCGSSLFLPKNKHVLVL